MALWLVLVLVLSVENGTVRGNSVDIMDAIINQVVISMQREMDSGLKSGTVEPEKEELPEEEGVHPSTVLLDNWIRIIKKEMEKIGLMPSPDFETGEKRTSDLATRIIKKGGQQNDGQAEDLERLKRSFWMWERSLNRMPQSKPAWFVLPGAREDGTERVNGALNRKERDVGRKADEINIAQDGQARQERAVQYNPMKSFWKWEKALNGKPKLGNTAWFVLDQGNNEKIRGEKRRNGLESFQRWTNPLHQSLTI